MGKGPISHKLTLHTEPGNPFWVEELGQGLARTTPEGSKLMFHEEIYMASVLGAFNTSYHLPDYGSS